MSQERRLDERHANARIVQHRALLRPPSVGPTSTLTMPRAFPIHAQPQQEWLGPHLNPLPIAEHKAEDQQRWCG
eukprot:691687-Amphidinium_carterae.1